MGAGGVERTRLHPSDLKFLAGYHPETDEVIEDHPIYGPAERDENGEPQALVPRDLLDEVLRDVKTNANVGQQAKNWRKHRSFLSSPFGPHPDRMDESPTYWQLSADGHYTFCSAAFWNQTFASHGGAAPDSRRRQASVHSMSRGALQCVTSSTAPKRSSMEKDCGYRSSQYCWRLFWQVMRCGQSMAAARLAMGCMEGSPPCCQP